MSVTVLTRRRARPGEEAALIEAVARSAERAGSGASSARLFQGYDDPEWFFRLAEWESREGPSGDVARAADLPDALCVGEAERQFFEQISGGDGTGAVAQAAGGAVVELPAAASGAARAFSDQVAQQMCATPGVARVAIYRDMDNPNRYLALCDWDSAAALQRFYAEALPRYAGMVREHGGKLDVFIERTRADVDRYPRADDEPRPAERPGLTPVD